MFYAKSDKNFLLNCIKFIENLLLLVAIIRRTKNKLLFLSEEFADIFTTHDVILIFFSRINIHFFVKSFYIVYFIYVVYYIDLI